MRLGLANSTVSHMALFKRDMLVNCLRQFNIECSVAALAAANPSTLKELWQRKWSSALCTSASLRFEPDEVFA
jgi:hypothetical protein